MKLITNGNVFNLNQKCANAG